MFGCVVVGRFGLSVRHDFPIGVLVVAVVTVEDDLVRLAHFVAGIIRFCDLKLAGRAHESVFDDNMPTMSVMFGVELAVMSIVETNDAPAFAELNTGMHGRPVSWLTRTK